MKNVTFEAVLEKLINEGHDEATAMLHEWFVEQCKCINNDLNSVAEDDEVQGDETAELPDAEPALAPSPVPMAGMDPAAAAGEELPVEGAEGDLESRVEELEAEVFGEEETEEEGEETPAPFGGESDDKAEEEDKEEDKSDESETEEKDEEEGDDLDEGFDFSDLEESFNHYDGAIAVPAMTSGDEIGAAGAKVSKNDKSPLPQEKVGNRAFKGKPVEIKATTHTGYSREEAPAVKLNTVTHGNNVQTGANFNKLSKVSKEGAKSAKLNSKEGYGEPVNKGLIGAPAAPKFPGNISNKK